MDINELKAKVKAAQEANVARIREAAEVARLEATLKLESSETLFNARVKVEAAAQQTASLQKLVDECAGIIAATPVHNTKTRTNRVWAGSRRFAYGTQIDLMYQLATGILYSCAEHKELLLAHTGLNGELVEQFVDAFGTPMYYSRNHNEIVEAKPYDIDRVASVVDVMQSELGVVVDTTKLTANGFEVEFLKAENTAHAQSEAAAEAIAEADFEI